MEAAVLTGRVDGLIEARELLKIGLAPLLEGLKDTSIPLTERWNAFTKLVENDVLINEMSYGDGFLDTLGSNLTMYDDFNTDRGQTMTFPDMYERIMDTTEEYDREWHPELLDTKTNGNLEKWQEEVLASGFASFCYDW